MTSIASTTTFQLIVATATVAAAVFSTVLLALLVRDWRRGRLW